MSRPVLHTSLCNLLDIEYPVMLAGMSSGWAAPDQDPTPPPLVAAVSNAGGLGVMGASGFIPDMLRDRIHQVRSLTTKPFGVDLLLPASLAEVGETRSAVRRQLHQDHPRHVEFVSDLVRQFGLPEVSIETEAMLSPSHIRNQVEVLLEEEVPVFAAGLGDPAWVVPQAREQGMKVIGLVGSVRNALRHVKAGVDVIVAQGYEAGGHTGRIANFPLIPQVVDAVKPIPVVAAGGIADGRGVGAALALGAVGVWVGTAFLRAEESAIPREHTDQILAGTSSDFVVTRSYTGKTARDYHNEVIDAWDRSGLEPLPMPLQRVLMEDFVVAAVQAGRYELINNPAGQIGGMLKERKSAAAIMEDLVQGAVDVLQGLQASIDPALEGSPRA